MRPSCRNWRKGAPKQYHVGAALTVIRPGADPASLGALTASLGPVCGSPPPQSRGDVSCGVWVRVCSCVRVSQSRLPDVISRTHLFGTDVGVNRTRGRPFRLLRGEMVSHGAGTHKGHVCTGWCRWTEAGVPGGMMD